MASSRSSRHRFEALGLLALLLPLSGCLKHEIASDLSEQEAQEIIVLLKEHGLDAARQVTPRERAAPSATVYVRGGSQNVVQAWRIMQENGLPRQRTKGLEDVFAERGMIPTAAEEKARLLVGLSGQISRTLRSVEGVVDAHVQVVLPENSPLLDKSQWRPPSAAVLLKYRGNQRPLKDEEIRNLVAKGVEGLLPENIAVVFNRVDPKPPPAHDIWWYIGSEEMAIATLGLLVVACICLLVLLARYRRQRARLKQLTKLLEGGGQTALIAEGTARR